jgi:hypothetical protein
MSYPSNLISLVSGGEVMRTYGVSLLSGQVFSERVTGVEDGQETDDVDFGRAAVVFSACNVRAEYGSVDLREETGD